MSEAATLKRSPLHDSHVALGARMVPFAGWEMPVQYSGIVDEHKAVRERVGVFDISHMGQFLVEGRGAEAFLNRMLTNNISKLAPGQGQYTLLLNERGGVIDDLIAYRLSEREFFLVVNASMIDVDFAWLKQHVADADVRLVDISSQTGGLAIQGPKSREVLRAVLGEDAPFPDRNTIFLTNTYHGPMFLCGTGYTGEEGFELFAPADKRLACGSKFVNLVATKLLNGFPDTTITHWFEKFVNAAREQGGMPAGLGARDTLRLEMGYPLNGNDLSPEKTPIEAGLGFFVDLEKSEFIGRDVLFKQKTDGVTTKLTGFRMTAGGPPPRAHYPVYANSEIVGEACSAGLSPSLGHGIGMAYLPVALAKPGNALEIEIRGKRYAAETVRKPFYRKPTH